MTTVTMASSSKTVFRFSAIIPNDRWPTPQLFIYGQKRDMNMYENTIKSQKRQRARQQDSTIMAEL